MYVHLMKTEIEYTYVAMDDSEPELLCVSSSCTAKGCMVYIIFLYNLGENTTSYD